MPSSRPSADGHDGPARAALDELASAGLLARDEAGAYLLTGIGAQLAPALESLDTWARRWSETLGRPDDGR